MTEEKQTVDDLNTKVSNNVSDYSGVYVGTIIEIKESSNGETDKYDLVVESPTNSPGIFRTTKEKIESLGITTGSYLTFMYSKNYENQFIYALKKEFDIKEQMEMIEKYLVSALNNANKDKINNTPQEDDKIEGYPIDEQDLHTYDSEEGAGNE